MAWLACVLVSVQAAVLYVDINSPNPQVPYTDLTTAATSIQDAVDAATNGDLVLVNDGYYDSGTRTTASGLAGKTITNRLVIAKALAVQSINGPSAVTIGGDGLYRCVYLTNGAALNGVTLQNGAAGYAYQVLGQLWKTVAANGGGVCGGAVSGGTLSNCVLTANTATDEGGGAYAVTLINCQITGNSATNGGGAAACELTDCLVTGNSTPTSGTPVNGPSGSPAHCGGGLYLGSAGNCVIANNSAWKGGGCIGTRLVNCTVVNNSAGFSGGMAAYTSGSIAAGNATNSIIYFNYADTNANYDSAVSLDYCCTYPPPSGGAGNLTNDPALVNPGGDNHLTSGSPCINSGNNAAAAGVALDLDGNPRLVAGTVDLGAYEYQTPASVLSYAWALQYGLATDGTADGVDEDGTGMNNWQKWVAGLNPTNPASVLVATAARPVNPAYRTVTWQSVATRSYYVQRGSDLGAGFVTLQSNIVGQAGTTTITDDTATNGGPYFYRVGVQW